MNNKKNIGSSFQDFLQEEGIQEEVNSAAIKAVIARNIKAYMKKHSITQADMAHKLQTSRTGLKRLLDPDNYSITLLTLNRAAAAIDKKLTINLTDNNKSMKK